MPLFNRIGDISLTIFWVLVLILAIARVVERIIKTKNTIEINDRDW